MSNSRPIPDKKWVLNDCIVPKNQMMTSARIAQARVISFAAPTTSPFTPPNKRLETRSRIVGHKTATRMAPINLKGAMGMKRIGAHKSAAMSGKWGCENW